MTTSQPAPTCCSRFQYFIGLILFIGGIGLSAYAYYVEYQLENEPGYKALCDIDESHSCSSVFNSTYGRGFGIVGKLMGNDDHPLNVPNSIYGIAFYSFLGMLFTIGSNNRFVVSFEFYMLILANCMSIYLGYLLYAVLKTMCVVCISTYGVNLLLLLTLYCRRSALMPKGVPEYLRADWKQPGLPEYASKSGGPNAFKKNI